MPGLSENLISIGKIEEKGYQIVFAGGFAKIIDSEGVENLRAVKSGSLWAIESKINIRNHQMRSRHQECH